MNHHQLAAAIVSFGLLATLASAGPKQEPHFDIWISIENNRLVTGAVKEGGTRGMPGVRVFAAELGEEGIPFFAAEPGFEVFDGTLAPGSALGFDLVTSLGQWNGEGFDSLDPLIAETMTLSFAGGALSATTGSGFVEGFDLLVNDRGGLHDHLDFTLNGAGDDPSLGIYLLELRFTTTMAGILSSESAWIVFNNGLSEREHEAAIAWVESRLVPSPATLVVLAFAGTTARRRRR